MYISELFASGFRCFDTTDPLRLALSSGLNVLVGPNDAGKSAIVDVARYVLWTRGDEYIRPDEHDFHVAEDGTRGCDFTIRCSFDDLSADEQARFLEWCSNERGILRLHVCMRATRRISPGGSSIVSSQHRAGIEAEGLPIEGELREYLKATYLKPLRDAEREMRAGRRSRLSRILGAMPVMGAQSKPDAQSGVPTLHDTLKAADADVRGNATVGDIAKSVNVDFLEKLSFATDPLVATLDLGAGGSFDQVLERFELYLNSNAGSERVRRGLGYNNLLFMAAELLLLQSHPDQVSFLLIEEPEAHLHPQHQTLFMEVLAARAARPDPQEGESHQQVQVVVTTHSPQLAASVDLENMTMIVGHRAFPLGFAHTQLDEDDYEFLRRFLDATKANLFFARALIVVEGDGEHLLIPALAEKLGRPLSRYGVSIINVGHRGLFRYSRILQRRSGNAIPIPVALVADRDLPPPEARGLVGDRRTEDQLSFEEIEASLQTLRRDVGDPVEAFISAVWTLEFDLALQPEVAENVHQAIQLAKTTSRKPDRLAKIMKEASEDYARWKNDGQSATEIAVKIFKPVHDKRASKAAVAEQLARLLLQRADTPEQMREWLPPYLVRAIDYVTGGYITGTPSVATDREVEREESCGDAECAGETGAQSHD